MNTISQSYTTNPGYITNPDFEISGEFPPKPAFTLQHLFDCRMQLPLYAARVLEPGESSTLPTTCIVHPNNNWHITIIGNPELGLITREHMLQPQIESLRIFVKVTNISNTAKHLPASICIGYLLLRCN